MVKLAFLLIPLALTACATRPTPEQWRALGDSLTGVGAALESRQTPAWQPPPAMPSIPYASPPSPYSHAEPPHGCVGQVPVDGPGVNPCPGSW